MKSRKIALLLAAVLLTAACSIDEELSGERVPVDAEEVTVTLSAQLEQTKVDFSVPVVNVCHLSISYGNSVVEERTVEMNTDGGFTFPNIRLVKGQAYQLTMWAEYRASADVEENYTISGPDIAIKDLANPAVTGQVSISGNNQEREIYGYYDAGFVVENVNTSLTLTRRTAVLTFTASDLADISADKGTEARPDYVALEYKNMPLAYNIATGVTTGTGKAVYSALHPISYDVTAAEPLAHDYVFVPDGTAGTAVDVDVVLYKSIVESGTTTYLEVGRRSLTDIQLRLNYITRVTGQLSSSLNPYTVIDGQYYMTEEYNGKQYPIISITETGDDGARAIRSSLLNGISVKLTGNLSGYWGSSPIIAITGGKDVMIDLNGYDLTLTPPSVNLRADIIRVTDGSTLVIKNGKIQTTTEYGGYQGNDTYIVGVGSTSASSGHLILDNVHVISKNSGVYVGPYLRNGNSTLTIINSVVEAANYSIGTDEYTTTVGASGGTRISTGLTADVTGTTLISDTPVMWGAPCILNLTDCELQGTTYGLVARAGNVTAEDCIIYNTPSGAFSQPATWGLGNEVPNSPVVIGNRHTTYYQYPVSYTARNTVMEVRSNSTEEFYVVYVCANETTGLGASLSYDQLCYILNNTGKTGPDAIYLHNPDYITVNAVSQ